MDFQDRLKNERKRAGLTQDEFGKKFSLSKQAISSYENGISYPNPDTLKAFANFFDVSVDYLLGESNVRRQHDVLAFHTTGDLTEEEWEEVKRYVDYIRSKRDD
jgi:transcriptional regulator with XRE-family HTH domain